MFMSAVQSTGEHICDSSSVKIYFRKEAFRIAIYEICYSVSIILLL